MVFDREITTQIEINKPIDAVKAQFFDIKSWDDWNPFIKDVRSTDNLENLTKGQKLNVNFVLLGNRGDVVVDKKDANEFAWIGLLYHPLLFSGRHYFKFETTANGGTLFTQGEHFGGTVVPVFFNFIKKEKEIHSYFVQLNEGLKKKVEGSA